MAAVGHKIEMQVCVTQPGLNIETSADLTPSQEQLITFGQYFKGDTGEKGEPGESDHSKLINRHVENQHPISAITGLAEALENSKSRVCISNTMPTEPNILIWIDTSLDI